MNFTSLTSQEVCVHSLICFVVIWVSVWGGRRYNRPLLFENSLGSSINSLDIGFVMTGVRFKWDHSCVKVKRVEIKLMILVILIILWYVSLIL